MGVYRQIAYKQSNGKLEPGGWVAHSTGLSAKRLARARTGHYQELTWISHGKQNIAAMILGESNKEFDIHKFVENVWPTRLGTHRSGYCRSLPRPRPDLRCSRYYHGAVRVQQTSPKTTFPFSTAHPLRCIVPWQRCDPLPVASHTRLLNQKRATFKLEQSLPTEMQGQLKAVVTTVYCTYAISVDVKRRKSSPNTST